MFDQVVRKLAAAFVEFGVGHGIPVARGRQGRRLLPRPRFEAAMDRHEGAGRGFAVLFQRQPAQRANRRGSEQR